MGGDLGPRGRVGRLRAIRAQELTLPGGVALGAGPFGVVQAGVWNDTDVAIKTNGVDCRDLVAVERERQV